MPDFYSGHVNDVRELMGARRHEIVDASAGDASAESVMIGRWFEVDRAGIIKLEYQDVTGKGRILIAQVEVGKHHFPNVRKVFKQYKAGTDCTAGVYRADGSLVIGVRIVE